MPGTTIATGTFSSRKAANQAIERLVSSGFARNSIELHPHDDDEGVDLEVHTRKENRKRVQRLMRDGWPMSGYGVRRAATGAVQTARSHPVVLLGAGILAGFIIYNLIPRSSEKAAHSRSSGSRTRRKRS